MANDHIDLTVAAGEIHALLGENGAGKTTLMNVLYGLIQPDEGEVLVDGEPQRFGDPGDAIAAGIGMVHQHFMLVPVFTVAENILLGREPTRGPFGLLDRRRARKNVLEVSHRHRLAVDPDAVVEDLPVGVQQRVEIVKALTREAQVLILDEPTAVLTPQETGDLFEVMRSLKEAGRSVVFITHKLREVKRIADAVTVIRHGQVVKTTAPTTSEAELASFMVGRPVMLRVDKEPAKPADPVLQVDGLSVVDERDQRVVDEVSFDVRAGEVLAVAGVQGNGQTELVEALMGLRPATGSIRVDGRELSGRPPRDIFEAGVGYVPEDRQRDGLVGAFTIAENLILDVYNRSPFARGLAMTPAAVKESARERVQEFDIRTASVSSPASSLSGGNQQKVVVARELSRPLRLFVASQPTRGLDVGSTEFVHNRLVAERDKGSAVLIVSTELDEVMSLADRIAVMYQGRIVDIVGPDTSRDRIGLMMAGAHVEGASGIETGEHQ
ncbi:MAG: ABC transporter ATP-binding protein [Streptosporangiaceae bacterium]